MPTRNAVILAAGTSSRFVPLSYERPKGLLEVRGEVLIERQIRQLREAGVQDITIVVGYQAEKFRYLREKWGVSLVVNEDYAIYNNTSSIIRVLDRLGDTFICSSDNYFPENVFLEESDESYYSALYAEGETGEYCLTVDDEDNIIDVKVGGSHAWYMVGHVFFNKEFSAKFREVMKKEYDRSETRQGYWEDVYIRHLSELPMKIRRYDDGAIHEFDTLDDLRAFDVSYINDTRSSVIKDICMANGWQESQLSEFRKTEHSGDSFQFTFAVDGHRYLYDSSLQEKVSPL